MTIEHLPHVDSPETNIDDKRSMRIARGMAISAAREALQKDHTDASGFLDALSSDDMYRAHDIADLSQAIRDAVISAKKSRIKKTRAAHELKARELADQRDGLIRDFVGLQDVGISEQDDERFMSWRLFFRTNAARILKYIEGRDADERDAYDDEAAAQRERADDLGIPR